MTENYKVLERETNRLLPALYEKMIGSGSLSLDTDSMSLADPHDRHYLEWLARIMAGFVLAEQNAWAKQVGEFVEKATENQTRMNDLDNLLGALREAADNDETSLEDMKALAKKYRDPMENYYDKMRAKREGPRDLARALGMLDEPSDSDEQSK